MKINDFTDKQDGTMYYHVTETAHLHSIMKRGLIPTYGRRGIYATDSTPAIYLFKSISDAQDGVMNWLGDQLDEYDRIALLEITLDSSKVVDDPELHLSAVMTSETIPPENIKVITKDF